MNKCNAPEAGIQNFFVLTCSWYSAVACTSRGGAMHLRRQQPRSRQALARAWQASPQPSPQRRRPRVPPTAWRLPSRCRPLCLPLRQCHARLLSTTSPRSACLQRRSLPATTSRLSSSRCVPFIIQLIFSTHASTITLSACSLNTGAYKPVTEVEVSQTDCLTIMQVLLLPFKPVPSQKSALASTPLFHAGPRAGACCGAAGDSHACSGGRGRAEGHPR